MQASLPRMVRMVCVEDLGQGSESIRILGVKWLPRGAAGKSVSSDGDYRSGNENDSTKQNQVTKQKSEQGREADEDVSKDAYNRNTNDDNEKEKNENDQEAEGLEAEDGEFVNLELAFAYRASETARKVKDRERNAHLYMAFYLPGGIKFRKFCLSSLRSRGVHALRCLVTQHAHERLLTCFSCMGRAERPCRYHAHADAAYTRPTLHRAHYYHLPRPAESRYILHTSGEERTQYHGCSTYLELRSVGR